MPSFLPRLRPSSTSTERDGTTVNSHAGGASSQTLAAPDPRLGLPVAYDKTITYQDSRPVYWCTFNQRSPCTKLPVPAPP